ncbi:hypothetical protein TRFO_31546 [Tritrichomonas foetus]|uniref:Uncharacterized protein n=1 Tax=Tritrichomonas foetus TaxID=1144522 RepID=A0A1J4JQW1_9EUKA|nr:hypothetical protein TRFO_31546 [Tritrichomonas foetus]|eukprot:OHT01567.1 hypothetical protein TRFO_31546 [Tritrichomonas foetus]
MSRLLQFTSETARDIVLSLKQENKIIKIQQILIFLRAILNVDDPKIKGILFESYGHLKFQNPCVFTFYHVTNSETRRSFEYSSKGYLCLNFCSRVKLIDKIEYDFEYFVNQLSTPELYTNYVFKPHDLSQPIYDVLLYDNHDKYLYIIQMTISLKHNFEENELLSIINKFNEKNVEMKKVIYLHFRNYPPNKKESFLKSNSTVNARQCLRKIPFFHIYYATLNIDYTSRIRAFYENLPKTPEETRNELMLSKIST